MSIIPWARYPLLAQHPPARAWLTMQAHLGLAPNTLAAYGRGLQEYFAFCDDAQVLPDAATRLHIAAYVHSLSTRPQRRQSATVA